MKTILSLLTLGAVIIACSNLGSDTQSSTSDTVKVKVNMGAPHALRMGGGKHQLLQTNFPETCTLPKLKAYGLDSADDTILDSKEITDVTINPNAILSADSGADGLITPVSATLDVTEGTARVFTIVGMFWDTSDCTASETADAYTIFGTTDLIDVESDLTVTGQAWISGDKIQISDVESNVPTVGDSSLALAAVRWIPHFLKCSKLDDVTLTDVDLDVSIKLTTGFSSAPEVFYISPLPQRTLYQVKIDCDAGVNTVTRHFRTRGGTSQKIGFVF